VVVDNSPELETLLEEEDAEEEEEEELATIVVQSSPSSAAIENNIDGGEEASETPGGRYCLIIGKNSWFENAFQLNIDSDVGRPRDIQISSRHMPYVYGMPSAQAFAHLIAPRVVVTDGVLYICVHNPMTSVNIIEMKDLINKAERKIILVLILPLIEYLEEILVQRHMPLPPRLHAHKDCRFVRDMADFDAWLRILTMGFFLHCTLIFPYKSQDFLEASAVWSYLEDSGFSPQVLCG